MAFGLPKLADFQDALNVKFDALLAELEKMNGVLEAILAELTRDDQKGVAR
jgi:hypothetical protein